MDPGLKKRLVGAVVLIALAVIFVPMLLPGNSGSQSVSVKAPPQPGSEMQTRVLAVGPDGASAGSNTAAAVSDPDHVATLDLNGSSANRQPTVRPSSDAPAKAPAPLAAPPGASASAPPPVQPNVQVTGVQAPTPSTTTEPVPGGASAAAGAIYTVNLGIYADHASANKLVANAKTQGFTALATPEIFQGKSVLRVRVGPFPNRAAAEAARLKLQGFARVSATVDAASVNQTGDAPPAALPASQPGAWAVQLAAFTVESQANALRDRLRSQGFDGYVDGVSTSGGKFWRVRAGPFATREAATAARGDIAQKLTIKGDIVTQ